MSEEKNIKEYLLKIANENVNKNLEEMKKQHEERIKREIEDVNFILELIEKKMIYKVVGEKYVMITKEIFLNDYMSEPKESWHKKGITIKDWNGWKESYDLIITINNEVTYKHIGNVIKDFRNSISEKTRRIQYITDGLWELEQDFNKLVKQEKNIMKFIKDYNEANEVINNDK